MFVAFVDVKILKKRRSNSPGPSFPHPRNFLTRLIESSIIRTIIDMHFSTRVFEAFLIALELATLVSAAPVTDPVPGLNITNAGAKNVVPNSYIVVYKKDTKDEDREAHEKDVDDKLKRIPDSAKYKGIGAKYNMNGAFKGYQVETSLSGLAALKSHLVSPPASIIS
jgi:hypothetical protein